MVWISVTCNENFAFDTEAILVIIIIKSARAGRVFGTRDPEQIQLAGQSPVAGAFLFYRPGAGQHPGSSLSTRLGPTGRNPGASQ